MNSLEKDRDKIMREESSLILSAKKSFKKKGSAIVRRNPLIAFPSDIVQNALRFKDSTTEYQPKDFRAYQFDIKVIEVLSNKIHSVELPQLTKLQELTSRFWSTERTINVDLLEKFHSQMIPHAIEQTVIWQEALEQLTQENKKKTPFSNQLSHLFEKLIGPRAIEVDFSEFLKLRKTIKKFKEKEVRQLLRHLMPYKKKDERFDFFTYWSSKKLIHFEETNKDEFTIRQKSAYEVRRAIIIDQHVLITINIDDEIIFEHFHKDNPFNVFYTVFQKIYKSGFGNDSNLINYFNKKNDDIIKDQVEFFLFMSKNENIEELDQLLRQERIDWHEIKRLFQEKLKIRSINWNSVQAQFESLKLKNQKRHLELLHILIPAFSIMQFACIATLVKPREACLELFRPIFGTEITASALNSQDDPDVKSRISILTHKQGYSISRDFQIGIFGLKECGWVNQDVKFATFYFKMLFNSVDAKLYDGEIVSSHLKLNKHFINDKRYSEIQTNLVLNIAGTQLLPKKISFS